MVWVKNVSGDFITELLVEDYEMLDKKPAIKRMPSLESDKTLKFHIDEVK